MGTRLGGQPAVELGAGRKWIAHPSAALGACLDGLWFQQKGLARLVTRNSDCTWPWPIAAAHLGGQKLPTVPAIDRLRECETSFWTQCLHPICEVGPLSRPVWH